MTFGPVNIDCTANPMDLRPAADIIVARALEKHRIATQEGRRAVLLMGEEHGTSSHIALQQLVASRLIDAGLDFSVTFELPVNSISRLIRGNFYNASMPEAKSYDLTPYDPSGSALLLGGLRYLWTNHAPMTNKNLWAFCYYNRLPSQFVDTGYDHNPKTSHDVSIDSKDPMVRYILDNDLMNEEDVVGEQFGSLNGMLVRNLAMALRLANTNGFIMHTGGASHMAASTITPHEISLAGLLQ